MLIYFINTLFGLSNSGAPDSSLFAKDIFLFYIFGLLTNLTIIIVVIFLVIKYLRKRK